jgi:MFS transporter, UMF1 family
MQPAARCGKTNRRARISWAFYDWANSAFPLIVVSAFFPVFLKQYWNADGDPSIGTFMLGVANSAASIVVALLAPIAGAIADRGAAKKKYLIVCTAVAAAMTAGLSMVAHGNWPTAVALFVVASIGFSIALIFYDALIVDVASKGQMHRVSALGYGLGYLGGGLLLVLNVAMTIWPKAFGLADGAQAIRASFVLVALWWALFTIPLLVFVTERRNPGVVSGGDAVAAGLRQVAATLRQIRRMRTVWLFLLAYWCYIDGVYTIARMAVDYGMAIGLDSKDLVVALLITQLVGFPASIAFGYAGERVGAKAAILAGIVAYMVTTGWSYYMTQMREFFVLAFMIGLVQGGVQSLSRSFYARLIPPGQAGEFFGFFNMVGKVATVLGPLMVGIAAGLTSSPRLSILAVLLLLIAGAALLMLAGENESAVHADAHD